MIRQCNVNIKMRLREVLDFKTHDIFVGELAQTHADDRVLTDRTLDIAKPRSLRFDMASRK